MIRWAWLLGFLALLPFLPAPATGGINPLGRYKLDRVNMKLHGQLLDFTSNHGTDNRIWSPALQQKRDLYVYLPPGYSPNRKYPLGIFLHGAGQDEQFFQETVVSLFDKGMADGDAPPAILVAPDGSILGRPSFYNCASWWANSKSGKFEDYLIQDVWSFMMENFPILPQRDDHVLIGVSMGGSAAYAHGMKYRDRFKVIIAFMPALNLRYMDNKGNYWSKFKPGNLAWRDKADPQEVVGRPLGGLVMMKFGNLYGNICGAGNYGPEAMQELSRINPAEIMERVDLKDQDLHLYVAYGSRDEFNMDAQVESFLYMAKLRGVNVKVDHDPLGRHTVESGVQQFAAAMHWAAPLLTPYRANLQRELPIIREVSHPIKGRDWRLLPFLEP